jgi:Holliday junction resolvasome RuvABC endonuclease subunit
MKTIEVIGIDPGSTHVGWAVLGMSSDHPKRPTLISCGERNPETIYDLIAGLPAHAYSPHSRALWATGGPWQDSMIIACERANVVFPREGFTVKMATALMLAAEVVGEMRAVARERKIRFETNPAGTWRKALCGSRSPSDAAIARALSAYFGKLPRCNAHERDAMGSALFVGMNILLGIPSGPSGPSKRKK